MAKIDIKFKHLETQNGGYITATGYQSNEVGRISYARRADNTLVVTHLNILLAYQGYGFGTALVQELVQFAQKRGVKIYTRCDFVDKILSRYKNFKAQELPSL